MTPSRDRGLTVSPLCLFAVGTLLLTGVRSDTELLFDWTNQTIHTLDNGTTFNLTLMDKDLHHFDTERNWTLVTEDDEAFQDWEDGLRLGQCHKELLDQLCHVFCGEEFYAKMMSLRKEQWCELEEIIRAYHELTECLERSSNMVGCFYPNPIVQELFLQIHSHFFANCSRDELQAVDPPGAVVLTLTLIPVALIPALVSVVIWKNQGQD
ncbi:unnamed protein product [Knipowitschia caucasica]|uniref:Uncharacterized protein n=1 Tax=Knipowitschia caucasica TaxID=637954 RepID=A0AAV2LIC4_KNICA